uniref:Uncharacterized protein n=1 Tax=Tetranychus urticae TaxID=32264 RepID=T1K3Y4_TETUR
MTKLSMIIGLFCLIGCLYQIYDITELYLQFKVRRDVAYEYATYIEMPAIDITVPLVMHMNLNKLLAVYPEEMNSICSRLNITDKRLHYTTDTFSVKFYETCFAHFKQAPIVFSHELAKFIKVKDVRDFSLLHLAYDLNVFITSVGHFTKRDCTSSFYYSGVAFFVRCSFLNGTKPFSVNTNFVSLNEGVLLVIDYEIGPYFGIRFSDHNDLPVYDMSKYFMITHKTGFSTISSISFVKTVMSSLEYPYETNCRHYNKAESISKCMTEYSLGQSTPYLIDTLVYKWSEHPDFLSFNPGKGHQRVDGKVIGRNDEHYTSINCAQHETATECEKTVYLVEGRSWSEALGKSGQIYVEHTWKANIYLSVHPVLPWSEYVIFIGSILGIWFGISIHDYIFKLLTYITTRIFKINEKQMKTKTKRITNQIEFKIGDNQRSI